MGEERIVVAGGKTQQEIDLLKKKHGKLTLVSTTDDEGNDIHFFFKQPDRATMSATLKVMQDDVLEGTVVFATNCLVDGDVKHFDNVKILMSISGAVNALIETRAVEVKNL